MAFWKPGQAGPGVDLERDAAGREIAVYNVHARQSLDEQRRRLPIAARRRRLLWMLERRQTVIVVGETGCGKSTQILQYLHEAGWTGPDKAVVCTQPRRVACIMLATRVAEEMGAVVGGVVGYAVRFDDCTSASTRIKYVTDGVLVRELMADPLLSRYSAVMIDEAHERSLYTDLLLGLLRKIQRRRPELRVIVSSATLDAAAFEAFFSTRAGDSDGDRAGGISGRAGILSVEGRLFPVDVAYAERPVRDYVQAAVETAIELHHTQPPGDILIFLTGQAEVLDAVRKLTERTRGLAPNPYGMEEVVALPMFAGLSGPEQMRAFQPARRGVRKVVVATNVAEASVTIGNIAHVIDCCFVKIRSFVPSTGAEGYVVVPASRASCVQRAGRAGRVRPGKAFRLCTEADYATVLPERNVPEMQRSNLAPVILQLKALGVDNVVRFDYPSPPPAELVARGLELLYALGALDDDGRLTEPLGVKMSEFPMDPMLAKCLLTSPQFGCSEEMVTIAAMLQVQEVFVTPRGQRREAHGAKALFTAQEGDHLTYLNVYLAYTRARRDAKWCRRYYLNPRALERAEAVRAQLVRYLRRFDVPLVSCADNAEAVCRCLVSGFFSHAAQLYPDGSYRTVRGDRRLYVHPSSALFGERSREWLIYHELVETDRSYMRDVTVIESAWLTELAPNYYEWSRAAGPTADSGRPKRARLD